MCERCQHDNGLVLGVVTLHTASNDHPDGVLVALVVADKKHHYKKIPIIARSQKIQK
jgi:hypothetical protein